jgi:hypothetical protein
MTMNEEALLAAARSWCPPRLMYLGNFLCEFVRHLLQRIAKLDSIAS